MIITKKRIAAGVVCLAFLALVLGRVFKKEQFAEAVSPPVMEAEPPVIGSIRLTTSVIGSIEPSDVAYIYSKASGDVTQVNVKAGDTVIQGQVLCAIDTKQVETAKNSMDEAALSLKQAQEELSRQQILYNSGGLSDQQYQQYADSVTSARLKYEQAQYAYETQLGYSQITSPIDGMVEICDVETYGTVSQNSLICVISGSGSRVVSFSVTERIRGYLKEGDGIEVEKDGQTYQGTVYEVSTMADGSTGLYRVKAALEPDAVIPTGSEVKLYVTSKETEDAMTVPVDAVYYENGEPYVYVYQDGAVYRRDIETGIYDTDTMEVLSGLSLEDMVITTWSSELYDGAQVILKNGDAATAADAQAGAGDIETAAE